VLPDRTEPDGRSDALPDRRAEVQRDAQQAAPPAADRRSAGLRQDAAAPADVAAPERLWAAAVAQLELPAVRPAGQAAACSAQQV